MGDNFGYSVSLSQDRALVGAPLDNNNPGLDSGSAYVFEYQPSGVWSQTTKLLGSKVSAFDEFGISVSLFGDQVLVGDSLDDNPFPAPYSGSVYVFDLQPLSSAATDVSLSGSGAQLLEVDAGHLNEGETYIVLGSISGTSPGIPVFRGFSLPLNPDAYFNFTFLNPNTPPLANSLGKLNEAGHAEASFSVPANLNPHIAAQLAGLTVHHAFATFLPNGTVSFVSNPLSLTLIP